MKLQDLEEYNPITIQCHDNPDADAIGSGYALYTYFKDKGKEVRLIYGGRSKIQKSNLTLMVEKLEIPIEYVGRGQKEKIPGLLITTDCQYGAGNVTMFEAENVAIIDHHQIEIHNVALSRIQSNLGSCSTLVWSMLKEEKYSLKKNMKVGTALYYGLYSDTNQFAELYNPLDMDMYEDVNYNKTLLTLFRNSNLSLKELEIAGIAMIRHVFNPDYRFAVIKAQPCDPNILGLISDFLLQVDEVDICVVYNELSDGFKLSIRSCIKEVDASELASFLTEGMGSGGGHREKAGGFISRKFYEQKYPTIHSEGYINNRMIEYFDQTTIIYAKDYEIDISDMKKYQRKKIPIGFVKTDEILPVGTPITVRTLEGDLDLVVEPDLYILIGIKGEVYPNTKEKFEKTYQVLEENYCIDNCTTKTDYVPTVKNKINGNTLLLSDYAESCVAKDVTHIHAMPIDKRIKVFTTWDDEKYMLGLPGDYLAVQCDDRQDIFIIEEEILQKTYEEMS